MLLQECHKTPFLSCTDSDCGVCSWPWQWTVLEKAKRPLPVTSNRCIPFTNTVGWGAGAVRVLKNLIQLFSEVFCVDTAVHTFHFRLVTNVTPNKRWLIFVKKSKSRSGRKGSYVYSRTLSRDSSHAMQISCILLRKWLQNSMSIKYVLSFQKSPRATEFCVTDNMLPASYEFTGLY